MEALMGKRVTPMWLAKEAIRFEQNVLAEHVGSQDQVAAAFGGSTSYNLNGTTK